MVMLLQLIFVLSTLISITVSSDVFRLVGSSVQLDIQHPVPEFDDLSWVFNRTNYVLKYYTETKKIKQRPGYEGRVDFNKETYSLTLKNLQKTDSGLYEVRASGVEVRVVAEYRLSVLDPVEAPVLTLQLSRDTCNITLTCRGHDRFINSNCYKETCEEKEVTSPGGVTLSLSVNGSSVTCNHSNPVSWKMDVLEMRELKRLCADEGEGSVSPSAGVSVCLLKTVLYSIILTLMLSAVITVHIRERLPNSS
ncbi:SLAM family member 9-like [Colossoma macropomum]|uniref:SLAM family member 9-like n=1 Tax=Colossoma macropomum TaxID=42526 RepID=UPI00186475F7|nr:SLAM family member 9-like [Colossoma macropomum]